MYYQYVLTSRRYSFSNYKRLRRLFKGDVPVEKRFIRRDQWTSLLPVGIRSPTGYFSGRILLDVEQMMLYLNRALDPCAVFIDRIFGVYPAITSLEIPSV